MPENASVATSIIAVRKGCVVAPAGCGKTYEIVEATKLARTRRLILTHTHAGIDVLRRRLNDAAVSPDMFCIDTIAAWCLKYSGSFPHRSGLDCQEPGKSEWNKVYIAAERLVRSGAVKNVLKVSFGGLFVDEYQDCHQLQHNVISAIADNLPVCLFGDPLQAIFDFEEEPIDWQEHVFPSFPLVAELKTPWRWRLNDNEELASWLTEVRSALLRGDAIDLAHSPSCVRWESLPSGSAAAQVAIVGTCQRVLKIIPDEDELVVIGDPVNLNARALLAQKLSSRGFTNIEPIDCRTLVTAAERIENAEGFSRFEAVMDFIESCMTGCSKTKFVNAVKSHQKGGSLGVTRYGAPLIAVGASVAEGGSIDSIRELIEAFYEDSETNCYRREMFFTMRAALRSRHNYDSLSQSVWHAQNQARHMERRIGRRSIGSTLLVKGLEFDHSVVVHNNKMSSKDWYVAITRASKSLTIMSPSRYILPSDHASEEPA